MTRRVKLADIICSMNIYRVQAECIADKLAEKGYIHVSEAPEHCQLYCENKTMVLGELPVIKLKEEGE